MIKAFQSRFSRWSLALVLTLGGITWISLNVWTAPLGFLWHVLHGRSINFVGQKIAIPWDMWVKQSDLSTTIIREAPKYRFLRSPWGVIVLVRWVGPPTNLVADYSRIARSEEQPREGFALQHVREVRSERRKGYCWESSRSSTQELSISCHFDNEAFSAAFVGNARYSYAFYKAIAADEPK